MKLDRPRQMQRAMQIDAPGAVLVLLCLGDCRDRREVDAAIRRRGANNGRNLCRIGQVEHGCQQRGIGERG